MPADFIPTLVQHLAPSLLAQADFLADWQRLEQSATHSTKLSTWLGEQSITGYINAKQLACPMPLLKLKMALKTQPVGKVVYLTATDPNSRTDIAAFAKHMQYPHFITTTDTIVHAFITKNC